jgi:mRNA-degrading endonuclease RelE of RelBE toxin-antitoxin system
MKVRFLSCAEDDLDHAIDFYEGKEVGLGLRFLSEVRDSVGRIVLYPDAWQRLSENTHRCRTKVFPYGIIYQIKKEELLIVAVAALHREPDYWKDRV